ncbi:MAG: alternative ribosome rescue aminoacyl-tRNA hydrolase ArfB [Longimicrobiales bacterium]
MSDDVLRIAGGLTVPRAELTYRATRGGGPGGQHVNTSSTRVELTWDVAGSPSLDNEQRARLLKKLENRIDETGTLRLVASDSRSQYQNREAVTLRFTELIAYGLKQPKPRKRTRPPRASKEARLRAKKQRGEVKKRRGRVESEE